MKALKIFLMSFLLITTHAYSKPSQVIELEKSFKQISGVVSAKVDRHQFSAKDIDDLKGIYYTGVYADLPIAMLNRTNGNLDNEMLITVQFEIEKNEQGLKALEFLSWWVRDISRSGENVQIRSIGLPPVVNKSQIQLGNTLKFWFEAYIVTEEKDMSLVLKKISELTQSLNSSVTENKIAFKE